MEKPKPHYRFETVKNIIEDDKRWAVTGSALKSAQEISIESKSAIKEIILALERKHFYKSMTSYTDHRIWQDVYIFKSCFYNFDIYLKFVIISYGEDDSFLRVLSFKESTS